MPQSSKAVDGLKWIDEEPQRHTHRPPVGEFETIGENTLKTILFKKTKENIFVPLGLIATVTCLTMGLISFRKGDSKRQQLFMRGRIGFQAFTLAAMTIGMFLTTTQKRSPTK